MGSCKSIAGRFAGFALLLAISACSQRTAPIDIPNAAPPPRAVVQAPQRPVLRAPAPTRPVFQAPQPQSTPAPVAPRPQIRSEALPPPNLNPTVQPVGTGAPTPTPTRRPQAVTAAQRPQTPPPAARPTSQIDDNPYKAFDPVTPPSREPVEVAEKPLAPPPSPPQVADKPRPPTPRASDDYTSLVGDRSPQTAEAPLERRPPPPAPPAAENRPSSSAAPTPPPAAAPGEKALVALLVPETDSRGSVRAIADSLAKAASLAAADINESRLEIRKYDTGGDPRKAAIAARNAISDGAKLIIGPLFSGSAAAVRPVAQPAGVNVIAFTTDQSVLGGGLYSIGFLPETDVDRIISFGARQGHKNIALMVPDSPFGGVISRNAQRAAGRAGASIVKVQPFKNDFKSLDIAATDFATYYASAPKVDSVVIATNGKTLQGLAAYLAFRDVLPREIKYMGLGLWDDKETFREATLRGGWFPGVDPALKNDFNYRYGQAYGSEPPSIALLGYDAFAVSAALIRNGGFSQQALQNSTGFNGMSGLFRFRSDGRNDRSLSILAVDQDSFRVIDPAPRSFSSQVTSLVGG